MNQKTLVGFAVILIGLLIVLKILPALFKIALVLAAIFAVYYFYRKWSGRKL